MCVVFLCKSKKKAANGRLFSIFLLIGIKLFSDNSVRETVATNKKQKFTNPNHKQLLPL